MMPMVGCSFFLAIVGFAIGFTCSLASTPAAWDEHLTYGCLVGGITFVAAFILAANDHQKISRAKRFVKASVSRRVAVTDKDFVASFPHHDEEMLIHVRHALGRFFDVAPKKIYATDKLTTDLRFHDLEPSLHTYLAGTLFADLPVPVHQFQFHPANLTDIGDLCVELQRMLDTATFHAQDADTSQEGGFPA